MKKIYFFFLGFLTLHLSAQYYGNSAEYIKLGLEDANTLIGAYTKPANQILIQSLSGGQYVAFNKNGHKRLSIGLQAIYLQTPASLRTYNLNDLPLQTVEAEDPNDADAQTILGDSLKTVTIVSKKKDLLGRPLFSFESPKGSGYPGVVLPFLSVHYTVGKHGVAHFGFIPLVKVPTTDLNVFMVRLGYQQDLLQWFHWLDDDKFDLSLSLTYGYFHGYEDLDITPEGVHVNVSMTGSHTGPYDNQRFLLDFHSAGLGTHFGWHANKILTLYAGTNLSAGSASLQLKGRYPVYQSAGSVVSVVATDIDDPLNVQDSAVLFGFESGVYFDWNKVNLHLGINFGKYTGGQFALAYKFL